MLKVVIKNGVVYVETGAINSVENRNGKISLNIAEKLFSLFNCVPGARIDLESDNQEFLDKMNPEKAFDRDDYGNLIVHQGSYCDYKIFYNTVKHYENKNPRYVSGVSFEISNSDIKGQLLISENKLELKNIYPEDINLNDFSNYEINYVF